MEEKKKRERESRSNLFLNFFNSKLIFYLQKTSFQKEQFFKLNSNNE